MKTTTNETRDDLLSILLFVVIALVALVLVPALLDELRAILQHNPTLSDGPTGGGDTFPVVAGGSHL